MTEQLPDPLVPPEVDLRDFAFMPLEINRLRKSKAWLWAKRRPELGFYMLNLWATSWHETPAASLEDDDDVLADAAMCDLKTWPKVRDKVLHGWVKCSDGRLYHPIVAEKAIEAWGKKTKQRQRTAAATKARQSTMTTHNLIHNADQAGRNEDRNERRDDHRNDVASDVRDDHRDGNVTFTKGRDREGKGEVPSPNGEGRLNVAAPQPNGVHAKPAKPDDPWKAVYDRGKEILGHESGGVITKLRKLFDNKPRKVLAKLEDAAEQREPLTWICAYLWNCKDDGKLAGEYIGGVPP